MLKMIKIFCVVTTKKCVTSAFFYSLKSKKDFLLLVHKYLTIIDNKFMIVLPHRENENLLNQSRFVILIYL